MVPRTSPIASAAGGSTHHRRASPIATAQTGTIVTMNPAAGVTGGVRKHVGRAQDEGRTHEQHDRGGGAARPRCPGSEINPVRRPARLPTLASAR